MKNIHITLTEFRNESRVLKEIASLRSSKSFQEFSVVALGSLDLPESESLLGSVNVTRICLVSRNLPKNAIFQLVKFFEFMIRCFLLIKRDKPTVVNVHALALLPFGYLLKKAFGVKLVYDAHELETEKNGLLGIRKKSSKVIESLFIKACDLVIVVGENIADWYEHAYQIERPIVVKNSPTIRARCKADLFRDRLGISDRQKIFLYQGGLTKGRGVELILEAFMTRNRDDVVAVFMGYGDLENRIKDAADKYSNIKFYPAVSPNVVLDYTSSADVGISIIENTCLSYFYCMPNKLFEYAMVGLPVIVSDMKEMAGAVQEHQFGVVIRDLSVESINEAVSTLVEQDLNDLSDRAYEFACSNSWEVQEKVMLDGYRRMLDR